MPAEVGAIFSRQSVVRAKEVLTRDLVDGQPGGGDGDGCGDLQVVRVVAVDGAGRADEFDVLVDPLTAARAG